MNTLWKRSAQSANRLTNQEVNQNNPKTPWQGNDGLTKDDKRTRGQNLAQCGNDGRARPQQELGTKAKGCCNAGQEDWLEGALEGVLDAQPVALLPRPSVEEMVGKMEKTSRIQWNSFEKNGIQWKNAGEPNAKRVPIVNMFRGTPMVEHSALVTATKKRFEANRQMAKAGWKMENSAEREQSQNRADNSWGITWGDDLTKGDYGQLECHGPARN